MYKFIVRQYGTTMGPYSAEDLVGMGLPGDVELMEEIVTGGEWVKLGTLNLDKLCEEEKLLNQKEKEEELRRRKDKRPPTCLNKWNWGAFTFPGLWGLFNGIYWPIIVRILTTLVFRFVATDITAYFGYFLVMLVISVVLAMKGNEVAWKKSKDDVYWEDFDASQKRWKKIGLVGLVFMIIINVVALLLSDSFSFDFGNRSSYYDYYDDYNIVVDTAIDDEYYYDDDSTYLWDDEF